MGSHRWEGHDDGFWDAETEVALCVPIRETRSHAAPSYYEPEPGEAPLDNKPVRLMAPTLLSGMTPAEKIWWVFYTVILAGMGISIIQGKWNWLLLLVIILVLGTVVVSVELYQLRQEERRARFKRKYDGTMMTMDPTALKK